MPKNNNQSIIFTIISFIGIIFIFYVFLYYSYDKTLKIDDEILARKLKKNGLQSLLNGSGINNIPNLNIITTNTKIAKANNCGTGPVYIGNQGTNDDCTKICLNSSAFVINVKPNEKYVYNRTELKSGSHCTIGQRPECDMSTSIALMTINSIVCRSKYPNIVGGPFGTTIVACNNEKINDPNNYLWDYKLGKKFDPWRTTIIDENELLDNDKDYRFRCKFEGTDHRGNKYEEHPFNRFHPISNYCAGLIYGASKDVKTLINRNDWTFECDCGNFNNTRVKNWDPYDKTSQCSNIIRSIRTIEKEKKILTLPYKCFTMFSTLEDVGKYLPCPEDKFINDKNIQMHYVDIIFTENDKHLIEHPMYKNLTESGVEINIGNVIE